MTIQFNLAGLRKSAGRSQAEVAALVGIPRHRVGRLESGIGSLETFAAVVSVLGGKLPDLRAIRLRTGMSSRTLASEIGTTHSVISVMEHQGCGSVATWHRAIGILGTGYTQLTIRPSELADANAFVAQHHRHHRPMPYHRFSLAAVDEHGRVRGVAIVGKPVARMTDASTILEVSRLCTDGVRNGCSLLYARAAQIAKAMGYASIQTFVLESEHGVSLRAAGWSLTGVSDKSNWGGSTNRPARQHDHAGIVKHRWAKELIR